MQAERISLYAQGASGTANCGVCERGCELTPGGPAGFCGGYQVSSEGEFQNLMDGNITTLVRTNLGWAPVQHFADPDTKIGSISGRGCMLRCNGCFNSFDAWAKPDRTLSEGRRMPPETIVSYIKAMGWEGVAGNFNEMTLAPEYLRDIFREAKKEGLKTVIVTAGYSTLRALDVISGSEFGEQNVDVYRCDIKATRPETMNRMGNRGIDPQVPLRNMKYMKDKGIHTEAVTVVRPDFHTDEELREIALAIRDTLGADTPWNVSPFQDVGKSPFKPGEYLVDDDVMYDGLPVPMKMRFGKDGSTLINVGDTSDEFDQLAGDYSYLDSVVGIGQEVGLTRVTAKIDGH